MEIKDSYSEIFKDVNRVLIVMAHPDDFEINCGGLAARLAKDNKKLRLVVTTNGEKGMKDKKDISKDKFSSARIKEQFEGAKVIGLEDNQIFNLNIPDGELENNYENIGKIAFHIREFKPDLVITHNAQDFIIKFSETSAWVNHRDHRNTASITLDAMYPYSRDRGFFPEHFEDNALEGWSVNKVLIADSYQDPEKKYFDISDFTALKQKGIASHKSAISEEDAADYIDENKIQEKYYEMFKFIKIY